MVKVYTSAVVIIPPQEMWRPIQEIRAKIDRHFPRWMPHITLIYPFVPQEEFNEIADMFETTCHEMQPFKTCLIEFKYFHHGKQKYTIWLNPSPSNLVIKLQEKLLSIVPKFNDVNRYKNGFIPHLSLGQAVGKDSLLKLLETLRNSWTTLFFLIDRIHFIAREPEKKSIFKIKKAFDLGNKEKN